MPRVRISESSDESDSDVPLSKIRAQSNVSDETQANLFEEDEDEHDIRPVRKPSRLRRRLSHSDDDDDDEQDFQRDDGSEREDSEDDLPLDRVTPRVNAKQEEEEEESDDDIPLELIANRDQEERSSSDKDEDEDPDFEHEDEEQDVPLSSRFSRLSKSKRPRNLPVSKPSSTGRKKEAKKEPVLSESDSEDDDVPLALKMRAQTRDAGAGKRFSRLKRTGGNVGSEGTKKRRRVVSKVEVEEDEDVKVKGKRRQARKGEGVNGGGVKRRKQGKEDEEVGKKFDKLGQRREAPAETDPARLFYESMYLEKKKRGKKSVMAETWMLRHGLLGEKEAKVVMDKIVNEKAKLLAR